MQLAAGVQDAIKGQRTIDEGHIEGGFPLLHDVLEEVIDVHVLINLVQKKITDIARSGSRRKIVTRLQPFFQIDDELDLFQIFFFIHALDLAAGKSQRIRILFQKLRMLADLGDVFRCNLLAVTDTNLNIVGGIA